MWSYILMAVGVTGIYLAGKRNMYGWALGVLAQILWIAYALATHQYGFIISALVYGWVYVKNFINWRRDAV